MKKVIVTGGAGFIGSHTAIELDKAGYRPVLVDNFGNSDRRMLGRIARILGHELPVHELDCRDPVALRRMFEREGECFGVIHFAAHKSVAKSVAQPLDYYDNNLGSLVALLRVMAEVQVPHLVFSSSATVYGQADTLPVTEQSPVKAAESPYGRTKQFCEAIIDDVVKSGAALKAVTLRYFNPVGAHPSGLIGELPLGKPENLVPFITQTAAGLRDELVVFGDDYPTPDGTCTRDYVHVVDLAQAHVSALSWLERESRKTFNEVFNVGTGAATSVLAAIRAFEQASNVKLRYRVGPRRPGDVVESYASVSKANQILRWQATQTIDDAMRDAWRWQVALREDPLQG